MIASINRVLDHEGKQYHLNCEDLGSEEAAFEVRVLNQGQQLWQKRVSYKSLCEQEMSRHDLEQAVYLQMDKTVQTVQAAIVKGRLP